MRTKFNNAEEALIHHEKTSKLKLIIVNYPKNYCGVVDHINNDLYFLTIVALRKKFFFSKVDRIRVSARLHPEFTEEIKLHPALEIKKGDLVSWTCLDKSITLPGIEGFGWIEYKHKLEFDHNLFQMVVRED